MAPGDNFQHPAKPVEGIVTPGPATVIKRKRRPARQQVKPGQIQKKPLEQSGFTYNICGDVFDQYGAKERSQTRCVIATDSGYTRADQTGNKFCCLFFARGCCPLASECSFLHRLPLPESELPDSALDCFGREKHATYRDDMGGVGSFQQQNRTIYVGRIKQNTRDFEQKIEEQFSEWGEIERIRCIPAKGNAYVTYTREHSAQFAKEAMMHQSINDLPDEILNIRWAVEDPNPKTRIDDSAKLLEQGIAGIAKKLPANLVRAVREMDELEGVVGPREEAYDDDTHDEEAMARGSAKRQRTLGSSADASGSLQAEFQQRPALPEPPKPAGLLSAAALDGLKQVAALRQQPAAAPSKPVNGLAGIGDYGSDDED